MNSLRLRDLVLTRTLLSPEIFAGLYVSLHAADPRDTGRGELTGEGYVRALVVLGKTGTAVCANTNALEYPDLPGGTITHFGVWDAERGGAFLTGGALTEQQVFRGQALRWAEGSLELRVG